MFRPDRSLFHLFMELEFLEKPSESAKALQVLDSRHRGV